jgi:hypothetical protein
MSNDFHIAALRKGIAVAVETKNPFSAELLRMTLLLRSDGKESRHLLKLEWPAHLQSAKNNFIS